MRKNENKGGRGAGGVILLRVGGNISHVWRVHKERDEKQPPLSKPKGRKIKRFENGAHKNTLTPIHRDLTIPNPPLILSFFLIYFLSPGFASFDPNYPFRLYWTFQKLPKQLKHSVLVFVFRGGGGGCEFALGDRTMDRYGRAPAMEGSPSDPSQEWTGPVAETGLEGEFFGPAFQFRFIFWGNFVSFWGMRW